MTSMLNDIQAIVDQIPRGKGRAAAKATDHIARQQLAAKLAIRYGYDRKIILPTHASEFPDLHPTNISIAFRKRRIA